MRQMETVKCNYTLDIQSMLTPFCSKTLTLRTVPGCSKAG